MTKTNANVAVPLDDVMIAMDVVDTLRHDKKIAERELNDAARRKELIERLRELYKGQGIEVPDHILEEGVKALAEDRFVYHQSEDDWRRKLATAYVTRGDWGQWVIGAFVGIAIAWTSWHMMFERPRAQEAEQSRIELQKKLPDELRRLTGAIEAETKAPEIIIAARQSGADGLAAAKQGDAARARKAANSMREMLNTLRESYEIRIVSRKGELSGLWRIPKINPGARNYYLIVEAVQDNGEIVPRTLVNEESGARERVSKWAQRVPKSVLDTVQSDKSDDGIIQNAVVGTKKRGALKPVWTIEVSNGALTRW